MKSALTRQTAFALLLGINLFLPEKARAGDSSEGVNPEALFQRGEWELSLNTGALFSPFAATSGRPTVNYTSTEVQLGYMLTDVKGPGWLRGNVEFAGGLFGGGIFEGKGNYVSGMTLWLRYNFVPQGWRLIPYVQGGMGLTLSDADSKVVGQDFCFNLDVGLGARYFLNRRWALNFEYRYQHISNANMAENNLGINAHGPMVGVSYFF